MERCTSSRAQRLSALAGPSSSLAGELSCLCRRHESALYPSSTSVLCPLSQYRVCCVTTDPQVLVADVDASESASSRDGDEYMCSLCYGSCLELSALIKHVNDEHAFQQRSAVRNVSSQCLAFCAALGPTIHVHAQRCPVCSRSVKDLLSHLLIHQRNAEERFCSSSSSQASSSLSSAMSSVSGSLVG